MKFYSTKSPDQFVDIKEAVIRSLPADNGLYMPEKINQLSDEFWASWKDMEFAEMGAEVVKTLFADAVPAADLDALVKDALNFEAPTVQLDETTSILELFHGPTLAFKDFGARFMARLMAYLTKDDESDLTVLVATSGDTGGAVADAFLGVEGTRVVILYPKGKVSLLQEKQLTALGGNITALEIDGSFDDCQRMVKSAFLNDEVNETLTSANSINISRLVPQMLYYFDAVRKAGDDLVFVVPSGNFGNLTAALIATQMGMPVKHFVAATNANDVVPQYLDSGDYQPRPSVPTISNAMDVGAPSNFARMEEIYGNSWEDMKANISGYTYNDEQTREAIRAVKERYGYTIDPHGAVGWLAAEAWKSEHPGDHTVILETAHPSKFIDIMEEELGAGSVEIPERLAILAEREKVATPMAPDEAALAAWLKENL